MIARIGTIVSVLASRKRRILAIGLVSALVGILIVAAFQFIHDHRWYWSVAPFLCVVATLTATFGGLLIGRTFSRTQSTQLWMVIIAALLFFIWVITGMLAASLGALGMSQLPSIVGYIGWETYTDTLLFSGAHIRFLQIAVGTGFIGGIMLGLGLAWRRVSSLMMRI